MGQSCVISKIRSITLLVMRLQNHKVAPVYLYTHIPANGYPWCINNFASVDKDAIACLRVGAKNKMHKLSGHPNQSISNIGVVDIKASNNILPEPNRLSSTT